jgi:hypothetical protein
MSDKIKPHHLGRKAILYVRQSSAHQVTHNQESRILQYAMRDRLYDLGSKSLTTISVARRPAPLLAPGSSGWWPRSDPAAAGHK